MHVNVSHVSLCVCVCRCSECDAEGVKECQICKGKRQLLTYIKLKVEWWVWALRGAMNMFGDCCRRCLLMRFCGAFVVSAVIDVVLLGHWIISMSHWRIQVVPEGVLENLENCFQDSGGGLSSRFAESFPIRCSVTSEGSVGPRRASRKSHKSLIFQWSWQLF